MNRERNCNDSSSLRRLKAEHLKARADQALQQGNYRLAWETYSNVIVTKPDKTGLNFLYSNRSLAYQKGKRYQEALQDAERAIELAPNWPKGQWRKGMALLGLQNTPAAVAAFRHSWRLQQGSAKGEVKAKLWQTIQKLTREQLANLILEYLDTLVNDSGDFGRVDVEAADDIAMTEATFRLITDSHRGQPTPGPYYSKYLTWITDGLKGGDAYILRAQIFIQAKCYLQARADATAAVSAWAKSLSGCASQSSPKAVSRDEGEQKVSDANVIDNIDANANGNGNTYSQEESIKKIGLAYLCLGQACLAEQGHPDRDPGAAFKALTKGTEFDGDSQELRDRLQEASEELTKEELERAAWEAYNEGLLPGGLLLPPNIIRSSGLGRRGGGPAGAASLRLGERVFRVECSIAFPEGRPKALSPFIRKAMRHALATAAGVEVSAVSFEGVRPHGGGGSRGGSEDKNRTTRCMEVAVHVVTSNARVTDRDAAFAKALQDSQQLPELVGGKEVIAALGVPDAHHTRAEIVDITPTFVVDAEDAAASRKMGGGGGNADNRQLTVPARPKLDLELPYRMYRLVTADGRPIERADKHPFCMSRVYYSAGECSSEATWVEVADGSCRWRQSGSEVRVLALKVPQELPSRDIDVQFTPFYLSVVNKRTGEVYLEGRLYRGVVPEDCFWTHCGGVGEDGCCISLRKMNLEVLARHWMHSEMWWVKLFEGHVDIAWDDYEKDYSDLPEEVLTRHRIAEAIKDRERAVEGKERTKRELLQDLDDMRKRKRQQRLNNLRTGRSMDLHS